MTTRLTLGYRRAVAVTDSCVAVAGQVVQGHEFHHTTTAPRHGPDAAWHWDDVPHGFVDARTHASYLHTHWAGHPWSARRFVAAGLGEVSG
jgi:cobyrinic acid a,c-diamide synthase